MFELALVIVILSGLALVAIPMLSSADPARLDLAAELQAEAMRFARTEAMRLGRPFGFRQQNGQKRMRVFSLETNTVPWTRVYDVRHPVEKVLWDVRLDDHPFAAADSVSTDRIFRGNCITPSDIYFDALGTARCTEPQSVPLERYEVTLSLGNDTRVVALDGVSGKVTIR